MKKYSYNLFPKPLVIVGYTLIILSLTYIPVSIFIINNGDHFYFPSLIVFIIIGVIMVSFKSKIIFDNDFRFILKESTFLSMNLSKEKINIPKGCNRLVIKQKNKKGTGYYRFVLPVSYSFKSYDMYLCSGSGMVRLMNTDYARAIEIGELIKSDFNIEYILE